MRAATLSILALLALTPALAQAQPIPPRPLTPPGSPLDRPAEPAQPDRPRLPPRTTPLPRGPVQILARPQIVLLTPPPAAGRETNLRFRLTNLGDANAVHLFAFRPGCEFDQKPGAAGLLRIDRQALTRASGGNTSVYTTSFTRRMNDARGPDGDGIAVVGGTAEFDMLGVAGAEGGLTLPADEAGGPDPQGLLAPDALARYQRTVSGGRNCEPSALVMMRGPDRLWRLLNPDGTRNETFRTDGSGSAIRGRQYNLLGRHTITITGTASLRSQLAPFMGAGGIGSVCEGMSTAAGHPDHPVGVRVRGDDILFRMRSGPNGTRCALGLRLTGLPAGATASARFSVTRVGAKCRMGSGQVLIEQIADLATLYLSHGFPRFESRSTQMLMPPVRVDAGTFQISQSGWLDPFSLPTGAESFAWGTRGAPMIGVMFCGPTAFNDHGIDLRLDRIDITLPEGSDFP